MILSENCIYTKVYNKVSYLETLCPKLKKLSFEKVVAFIEASFLNDPTKRNYLQAYQTRLKKLNRK